MSQKIAEFIDSKGQKMIVTAFVDKARDDQGRSGIQLTVVDNDVLEGFGGFCKLSEKMQDELAYLIKERRTPGPPTATGDDWEVKHIVDNNFEFNEEAN